jgi:hypothetical protein
MKNNNELGGSFSSFAIEAKQQKTMMSWDPSSLSSSALEEKTKRRRQASQFIVVFYKWRKKTKKWGWAGRFIVVSNNLRKTNIEVFFLGL